MGERSLEVRFGPAGKPITYKGKTELIPKFLRELGLNAFEYQAVRSLKISEDKAKSLAKCAKDNDVLVSLHGPYAINLSSEKDEVRRASIERLVKSAQIAQWMDAYLVVFHPGYYGGLTPDAAVKAVIDSLKELVTRVETMNVKNVAFGVETTGKVKQVGSISEVIEICSRIGLCKPVLDFAHIHARGSGLMKSKEDFLMIFDFVERELGRDAISPAHIHFTEVEYGEGGELRHHPLGSGFGPNFEYLAEALIEQGISAVIISESPILERDSLIMKRIYNNVLHKPRKARI